MASVALQATQTLQAIDDMYQVGRAIGAEDPCNPANIAETLVTLVIELINDFIDGVIQLAGMAGKNALFLILAILQEVYGPTILLGIQGAVGFLMGNVFGTIIQGIAMLLSSVDGLYLILMYLAAGVAMQAVQTRQDFIDLYFVNLIENMIRVLQLLNELALTIAEPFQERYENIALAYEKVREASQILGVEVDKRISEGSAYLDVDAVTTVRDLIGEAISLLMGSHYDEYMAEVNESLGFDLTEPGNFNFGFETSWNAQDFFSSVVTMEGSSSTGVNSWSDFTSVLTSIRNEMWNVDRSEGVSTGAGSTAIQMFMDT
tara:strand:+ start:2009 stop:2962 length:954 start_codon:yes stop_codon:yes gene_type:complete